jgi:2-polyprenyl-3-methyl-5-hydroxy-6-metoxy-1,4-benzoquinol methylase
VKALQARTAESGAIHHRSGSANIYDGDWPHADRLRICRGYLAGLSADVVELGCGTGDICGPSSTSRMVLGFDVNPECIKIAKQRFPNGCFLVQELDKIEPVKTDCLVLCEVLEHLSDPAGLVKKWAPFAQHLIVSHPLDEAEDSTLSAGDHQWSFNEADFRKWFEGFELQHQVVKMGSFDCIIGFGKKL